MKKCPNCASVYNDNMIIKCTNCGADLIEEVAEQPTQNTVPPQNNYTNYGYNYNTYNTSQVKYCTRCGNQCDPKAVICVKCGMQFADMYNSAPKDDDKPSGLLKVLCFFVPILGLILFLVNMNEKSISAKAYGKAALAGFIVSVVLYAILIVSLFVLPFIFGFNSSVDVYPVYPDSEFFYSIIHNII